MGASDRIGRDLEPVRSDEFAAACRRRPEEFTRRRKVPHDVLVESVVCRRGRTLRIEMRELGRGLGMGSPISVPGYLRQREKPDPAALEMLMRHHAAQACADGDAPTFRGMHVLAIDGSTANVPTNAAVIAAYGGSSARHGKVQAFCGLSAVYDVIARQVVGIEVTADGFDERSLVPGHVEGAREALRGEPFVVVMDHRYPSFPLLALLSHGPVDARCVLVDIGGEAPEKLVTNLPASFTPEDLRGLYHPCRGVETCSQIPKDRLQLENLTGTRPALIEQGIYATAYLLNVAFDIANEADAAALASGAPERHRHRMTVNRSFALGVVKDGLLGMLLAGDGERDGILAGIVGELKGCLVPVCRERSYPRAGGGAQLRKQVQQHAQARFLKGPRGGGGPGATLIPPQGPSPAAPTCKRGTRENPEAASGFGVSHWGNPYAFAMTGDATKGFSPGVGNAAVADGLTFSHGFAGRPEPQPEQPAPAEMAILGVKMPVMGDATWGLLQVCVAACAGGVSLLVLTACRKKKERASRAGRSA